MLHQRDAKAKGIPGDTEPTALLDAHLSSWTFPGRELRAMSPEPIESREGFP
jgi:hypothetical protein